MAGNQGPADGFQEENVFRLPLAVQPEHRFGSFVTKTIGDNEQSFLQDAIIRNGYVEVLDQARQRVLMRPGRAIWSELDRSFTLGDSRSFLFGIHYYGGRDLADTITPTLAVVSRGDLYINPIKSASTGQKWKALTDGSWNTVDGGFSNEIQLVSNSANTTTFAIVSGRGGTRSVYSTVNQGTSWNLLTSAPGWVARAGFRVIRLSSTFYIMGGRNAAGTLLNDVWSSTDGITWTQQTAAAGWAAREYFSITTVSSLIFIAGGDTGSLDDDVWSSPTGVTWTQRTAAAGWAARKNAGFVGSGTTLYLAGGEISSGNAFDFWISTNNGVTWSREFEKMPISARTLSVQGGTNTTSPPPPYSRPVLVSRLVATNGSTGLAFTPLSVLGEWWSYTADSAVAPGHGQFVLSAFTGLLTSHLTIGATIKKLWLGQVSPFYEQAYTTAFLLGGGEDADDDSSFKVYFEPIPLPDLVKKTDGAGVSINRTTSNPPLEGFALNSHREAYFYNTRARTLSKITSPNFPATTVGGFAWLNGRLYIMTPEGRIYCSGINDYTTWAALDFINAIMHPDRGVGILRTHNNITAFGRNSTEWFYDSGAAIGNPLRRVDSAAQDIGCIDPATIVRIDNSILFVGNTDNTEERAVYQIKDNYTAQQVSPVYVNKALAVGDFSGMHALPLFINGHRFYIVTGTCGGIGTWVYDLDTKLWFNWTLAQVDGFNSNSTTATATLDSVSGLVIVTITNANLFNQAVVGEPVKITGATPSTYNVETTVHTSPDFSIFTYVLPTSTVPTTPATGSILATIYPQYDSDGEASNPGLYKWTSFDSAAIESATTFPPSYALVIDEADGNVYRVAHGVWSDRDGLVRSIALGSNSLNDAADRTYIDFTIRTPRFDAGNNLQKFIGRCEVVGGNSDTQGLVRYSDTDYRTWSPYRRVDLTLERPRLTRQGSTRRRAYEYRQVFEPTTTNDQEVYSVEALELFYKQGSNV